MVSQPAPLPPSVATPWNFRSGSEYEYTALLKRLLTSSVFWSGVTMMPCEAAGGPYGFCSWLVMSGSLIVLVTLRVAKSTTWNPLSRPFCAKIDLVEPSGFFDTAMGDGAGSIGMVQATSWVFVSIT